MRKIVKASELVRHRMDWVGGGVSLRKKKKRIGARKKAGTHRILG